MAHRLRPQPASMMLAYECLLVIEGLMNSIILSLKMTCFVVFAGRIVELFNHNSRCHRQGIY